jgi:integrase
MALTDLAVRNAKPCSKPRKLFDSRGLFLMVTPAGGRWWRFKYRFDGKEKLLSLGTYPDVSLKLARDRRDDARTLVAKGIDPAQARRASKEDGQAEDTFEFVAQEWFAKFSPQWAYSHSSKIIRRLERDIFPWIGSRTIESIKAPELLKLFRRIEGRGALETAHRAKQNCGQVFRYAIATGRADRDPTTDLRGALPRPRPRHHPSITEPKAFGALLRAIKGYRGSIVTRCALQMAPLVFVRPGELRQAEWSEFDLKNAEWRIGAERMKERQQHIVPLAKQALEILSVIHPVSGEGRYVFPGVRSSSRPMSENTVNAALRALGYSGSEMTGHGFRSTASTLLNEQGWSHDAIERQLAHGERNTVRAAYNYAEYLSERRSMMQAWADYLDQLRKGAAVVPLHLANSYSTRN